MPHYNKMLIMGHLTRQTETRYTPNQKAVCDFGIASNYKSGQYEETCFLDCVAFGKTGELIAKFLNKGDAAFLEGRLKTESWNANDGSKRSKQVLLVTNVQFLGSGKKKEHHDDLYSNQDNPPLDDHDIPF